MSGPELAKHASRLKRRERIINHITSRLTPLRVILFIVGYAWLLLLPWKGLSRTAWIDENALQPGQVNVDWNWGDVKAADGYLEHLEALWNKNATSAERASYIQQAFRDVGLETGSQQYSFVTPSGNTTGINAYSLSRSSRSSGTEAIVIAASWISLQSETSPLTPKPSPLVTQPNLRGIATLLALARSLSVQHVWAKDLIFLVSDSYLDGAHAWLSAYHGAEQEGMHADALVHPEPAGVIWTAIVLDYPGHSFSHLGLFFEGTNGRLPNQDFANSASTISRSMGIPWVLYDHNDGDRLNLKGRGILISLLVELAEIFGLDVQDYWRRARNIVRNVGYQATGEPSGVHGVFHRYRIDAITLFALPARGPHGFHSLGRVVESLLRTSNNLLERLHASFFFYIFTAPGEFAEFAKYLPPVIILGLVASFGGLKLYVQTGWTRSRGAGNEEIWAVRDRPVLEVLCIMGLTHAAGLATLAIVNRAWFWQAIETFNVSDAIDLVTFPSIIAILIVCVYVYILYPQGNLDAITAPVPAQELPPSKVSKEKKASDQTSTKEKQATETSVPLITPLNPLFAVPQLSVLPLTTPALLKALNLCVLGVVISVLAVANFSLSAVIAAFAVAPLCFIPVNVHQGPDDGGVDIAGGWRAKRIQVAGRTVTPGSVLSFLHRALASLWVLLISPMGLLTVAARYSSTVASRTALVEWMRRMMWEKVVLQTWFLPVVCVLYLPLVLQGLLVCLLPPN